MADVVEKVVPVEPTEDMMYAADQVRPLPDFYIREAWDAMLSAAPQPAASDVPHDVVRALEEVEADLMSLSASCSDEPTSDKLDGVAGRVQQLAAALATPAPSTSTEEASEPDDYKAWYDEAMVASNAAGFMGISAAETIRWLAVDRNRLERHLTTVRGHFVDVLGYASNSIMVEGLDAALNGVNTATSTEEALRAENAHADLIKRLLDHAASDDGASPYCADGDLLREAAAALSALSR